MRKVALLGLVVLVALAGCNLPSDGMQTGTVTPTRTAAPGHETGSPPDPATDTIGWENGYWYNESIHVTNSDGLNTSEREAVVSRAMARVEYIRKREYTQSIPVETMSREAYRNRSSTNYTDTFRAFDNTKFEALFFIGESRDSLAVQHQTMGSSVLGFYSPKNDSIKLITNGGQPQIDGEGTLAHELTHALQDQRYNLSTIRASTRDGYNAKNGLIEGEANLVQDLYQRHCGKDWQCVQKPSNGGGSQGQQNWGVSLMEYFPYSDGPTFVSQLRDSGGWDAVDAAFGDVPASSEQIIYPQKYIDGNDPPTNVSLADSPSGGWQRVRPTPQHNGSRAEYATLGQSVLSSMFAYTVLDDTRGSLVARSQVFTGDKSDPINYDLPVTSGWEGDRMYVYRNPDAGPNQTAYVWRLDWESPSDAREFARGYRQLLRYHGATQTSAPNTWTIAEPSPFADAFRVTRDGSTVTIVNAPTADDLSDVHHS